MQASQYNRAYNMIVAFSAPEERQAIEGHGVVRVALNMCTRLRTVEQALTEASPFVSLPRPDCSLMGIDTMRWQGDSAMVSLVVIFLLPQMRDSPRSSCCADDDPAAPCRRLRSRLIGAEKIFIHTWRCRKDVWSIASPSTGKYADAQ